MSKTRSSIERALESQISRYRLPLPHREYRFAAAVGRQHRFDFAWTDYHLAVECDGYKVESVRLYNGEHRQCIVAGHGTPAQMRLDFDKRNMAVLLGWSVLVFTEEHVESGDAIAVIQRVLASRGWDCGVSELEADRNGCRTQEGNA